jgi:hydrogenase/urease accessory protein HupE
MRSNLLAVLAATPLFAHAHDGHGNTTVAEHGLWHWIAEPDHLAFLVLGALASVWAVRAFLRMRKDKIRDR